MKTASDYMAEQYRIGGFNDAMPKTLCCSDRVWFYALRAIDKAKEDGFTDGLAKGGPAVNWSVPGRAHLIIGKQGLYLTLNLLRWRFHYDSASGFSVWPRGLTEKGLW